MGRSLIASYRKPIPPLGEARRGLFSIKKNKQPMKTRHIFRLSLVLAAGLSLASCSEDLDSPVLPGDPGITVPTAQPLDADQLFGVWEATTSKGDNNQNYFEEQYRMEFQSVDDAEAVYSHWYTDAETGMRDSVINMEYTYQFDGSTVTLTPKSAAASDGAAVITATHTGGNHMLLTTERNGRTDSICTLLRTGDPEPTVTGVDRTMPLPGEVVTVTGRNLQFVDHIYLPTEQGELEIADFTAGSKELKFTLPEADYAQGSIRLQSLSAGVNCYSPAYMFCYNTVFFKSFNTFGAGKPYNGTDFEYTISDLGGNVISGASALKADELPDGHSLKGLDVINPDSLLSFFGDTPVAWPVTSGSDKKLGYIRFSTGDRLQHALEGSSGLFTSLTPCTTLAIQMELYVVSDGVPEWNTGYLSWRLNKNGGTTSGDYLANVAGWSADSPMSFEGGWRTFTIPLTAFGIVESGKDANLGTFISDLIGRNYVTILCLENYNLDGLPPMHDLQSFQFCIANIRLVPYTTPANTPIE